MNGFLLEPGELKAAELDACRRVIHSGWYVLGAEGRQFEAEWAAKCGVSHAIGVANGMDALEIALRACDVEPGDEVITTPMTAFATVLAILRSGATPVLADIDAESGLLNEESARRCLTKRTKAIVLVHLYGQLRSIDAWQDFCRENELLLLEDCAQAHGARSNEKVAGSFGTAAAFSFYPTKNLGALGDGGALVTDDERIATLAAQLRNYGQSERYHHPYLGLNSRLDEIQAAILLSRLPWLDSFTARRQEIAARLLAEIDAPQIHLLARPESPEAHVYHQFVVLVEHRHAFMEHLKSAGIETLIHYPVPVHHQDSVPGIRRDPEGLPVSESFASRCVSIPCHPQLTEADVSRIIEVVNEWRGP
jgi:dTDP-4-amino-4,6-dideoxygalactose transaminase